MTMNTSPSFVSSSKYRPAYDGAKFDLSGYCLKHPMIRLCKPTSNGGSSTSLLNRDSETLDRQSMYKILRKVCPMCGEHSLRNERKFKPVSLRVPEARSLHSPC